MKEIFVNFIDFYWYYRGVEREDRRGDGDIEVQLGVKRSEACDTAWSKKLSNLKSGYNTSKIYLNLNYDEFKLTFTLYCRMTVEVVCVLGCGRLWDLIVWMGRLVL